MTDLTVPLHVLVRASQALDLAHQSGLGKPMSVDTWCKVMAASTELRHHVNKLLEEQRVPVQE